MKGTPPVWERGYYLFLPPLEWEPLLRETEPELRPEYDLPEELERGETRADEPPDDLDGAVR